MRGEELAERLVAFAVRIIRLCGSLPKSTVGRHIAGQLLRSGTSVGAHYEEARGAESKSDFVHKMGIALKELRESFYWLKIVNRVELLPQKRITLIMKETDELCAILVASIKTAKKK